MHKTLLIGCGSSRKRKIRLPGDPDDSSQWPGDLVTLDCETVHGADVVYDLNDLPLPFGMCAFDRIDAYEVLEHCGRQGDARFFFNQFDDFWRMLKPGGHLCATVPRWDSPWAWGDPSHTRIISEHTLVFLDQSEYEKQVGKSPMTDFRHLYGGDFEIVHLEKTEHQLLFVLRARKEPQWTPRPS